MSSEDPRVTFSQMVREEKITDPTKRPFKVEKWNRDHAQHRSDAADDDLHAAGLWVFARLDAIRKGLRFAKSDELNREMMVRAVVAIANSDAIVLAGKFQAAQRSLIESSEATYLERGQEIKLGLKLGGEYRGDEIVQGGADAAQVAIAALLRAPGRGSKTYARLIDWNAAAWDLNMGVVYKAIEDIWSDCLWSGYVVHDVEGGSFLAPRSMDDLDRQVVSEHREQNLSLQIHGILSRGVQEFDENRLRQLIGQRSIVARERDGKRFRYVLGSGITVNEFTKGLAIERVVAREPYYEPLLRVADPKTGVTVDSVMRCWEVVASAIEVHWKELSGTTHRKERLLDCAPVLHRKPLCDAVSKAMGVDAALAERLVSFLTFTGEKGQEIWAQPLIALNPDHLAFVFHSTRSPNLARIVDVWLRQLGMDLSERGEPFEQYVRGRCRESAAESPLLSKLSWVCKDSLEVSVGGEKVQLDLVIRMGSLLIIGESKCMLRPSDSREWSRHREKVRRAVVQVKRKIVLLDADRAALRARLCQLGADLPETFELFPVVVLNRALNAGMPFDGVPIVDYPILDVFFRGALPTHVAYSYGKEKSRNLLPIYDKAEDAIEAAKAYLNAPPQMKPMLAGLRSRFVPLPPLAADVPGALQFLREVEIQPDVLPGAPATRT